MNFIVFGLRGHLDECIAAGVLDDHDVVPRVGIVVADEHAHWFAMPHDFSAALLHHLQHVLAVLVVRRLAGCVGRSLCFELQQVDHVNWPARRGSKKRSDLLFGWFDTHEAPLAWLNLFAL